MGIWWYAELNLIFFYLIGSLTCLMNSVNFHPSLKWRRDLLWQNRCWRLPCSTNPANIRHCLPQDNGLRNKRKRHPAGTPCITLLQIQMRGGVVVTKDLA